MTLSQAIRTRFNEITELRSSGVSWAKIDEIVREPGQKPCPMSVRNLYCKDLVRRTSTKHLAACKWASDNYEAIKILLAEGHDWATIVGFLPFDPGSVSLPTLNALIAEFKALDLARSQIPASATSTLRPSPQPELERQPAQVRVSAQAEPQSPSADQNQPSNPPGSPQNTSTGPMPEEPAQVREAATAVSPGLPGPALGDPPAAARAPAGLHSERLKVFNAETEQESAKKKAEEEKVQRKREQQANRKSVFHVEEDPNVSIAALRAEYDKWAKAKRERADLYYEIPETDESRSEQKLERKRLWDESGDMATGYYKLLLERASHRLANRSKLCVLSTAALSCGAYVLADAEAPDAITLCGFDRPDSITGMADAEIPDPLIIRPNLSQAEIERLEDCYTEDIAKFPRFDGTASTPQKLIAEALILRGAFEWRWKGWIYYDKLAVLSGSDLPSPSLCGCVVPLEEIKLAPPPAPGDPKKDEYPYAGQQIQAQEHFRGEWL